MNNLKSIKTHDEMVADWVEDAALIAEYESIEEDICHHKHHYYLRSIESKK